MARKLAYGMPTDKSAPSVQFGIAKGCFRDEGIDLETRAVYGGPAIAAALDRGELAFGHIGTPPALVALAGGARFRIVGGAIKRRLHLYLGVKSALSCYDELRGRRLGLLSLGSCDEWIARRMLQENGVDAATDVKLVPVGSDYDRIVDLVADGTLDAVLAIEPYMSVGEMRGVWRVWAAAYDAPYLPVFQWNVLVASHTFIREEAEVLRAVLRGYRRSSHLAARNQEEYTEFIAERFRLPREAVRRSLAREAPYYELDCGIDDVGLSRAVDLQVSLGALAATLEVRQFLDLRFFSDSS